MLHRAAIRMVMLQRVCTRRSILSVALLYRGCSAFVASFWRPQPHSSRHHRHHQQQHALEMVRNIDYPEAIILYGPELSLETSGLDDLLTECKDTKTPVIAIGYSAKSKEHKSPLLQSSPFVQFHQETSRPPSPQDLWQAIHAIEIQPQPFGGSSGFGAQQLLEPPRSPMPARVVVFCTTLDQTRAARAAGTRVMSLMDNDLADAVVDDFENLWLQDIATPGSFWLNPPTSRDDHGNRVNPEQLIQEHSELATVGNDIVEEAPNGDFGMDEDEMLAILADMAPL